MEGGNRNSFDNMSAVVTTSFLVDSILNQRQQQHVDVFENRLSTSSATGHPMDSYGGTHGPFGYQGPAAPPYLYGGERRIPKWERHGDEGDLGENGGPGGGPGGPTSPISPRYRMGGMDYLVAARQREEMMTFGDLKNEQGNKISPALDPTGLSCMVAEAERKGAHTNNNNHILPPDHNNNSKVPNTQFNLSV